LTTESSSTGDESEHGEVGKEIVEAVRTAVERATEG